MKEKPIFWDKKKKKTLMRIKSESIKKFIEQEKRGVVAGSRKA
jgi:hypothetical protein